MTVILKSIDDKITHFGHFDKEVWAKYPIRTWNLILFYYKSTWLNSAIHIVAIIHPNNLRNSKHIITVTSHHILLVLGPIFQKTTLFETSLKNCSISNFDKRCYLKRDEKRENFEWVENMSFFFLFIMVPSYLKTPLTVTITIANTNFVDRSPTHKKFVLRADSWWKNRHIYNW